MHSVEGRLEVPFLSFVGISSRHLMHKLKLQEQRRTRKVKTHIIADTGLTWLVAVMRTYR